MKRGLALFLVLALVLVMLPTPAHGVATTVQELKQQIKSVYRKAFRMNGSESFHGWCATFVSYQTYLLGIDTTRVNGNGNEKFDLYSKMKMTSGGYKVKAYPATEYTLKEALEAITNGGKQDAYNILVGFQKTKSEAGQRFGHSCFIHGIVDGIVYYTEGYNARVGGRSWKEGEPISCSIQEFSRYYSGWAVFEGVIYFGLKNYADICTSYPTRMDAMTVNQTAMMNEPVDAGVNEKEVSTVVNLSKGEIVEVTEILKTPGGNWWYAVKSGDTKGYVLAENLITMKTDTTDVTVANIKVPTSLHTGKGFTLGGTITTQHSTLKQVTFKVCSGEGEETVEHFSAQVAASGKKFALNSSAVDKKMTFRKLSAGTYRLSISAVVTNDAFTGDSVVKQESTVELWNSEFQVVSDKKKYYSITFDATGGICNTNQITYAAGEAVAALPTPVRDGYSFAGWYTLSSSGMVMMDDVTVDSNMTLYALWTADGADYTGWLYGEDGWTYLKDGSTENGWFTTGSVSFYRNPDGSIPTGWTQLEGKWYYFNSLGAAQTGWLEDGDKRYYTLPNGEAANGWLQIDDQYYWFTPEGVMQTGWLRLDSASYYLGADGVRVTGENIIDGKTYSFHEDGSLVTGWVQKDGNTIYLDETGTMVTGWQDIDGKVCYFGNDGVLYLIANDACSYGCLLNTGMGTVQP